MAARSVRRAALLVLLAAGSCVAAPGDEPVLAPAAGPATTAVASGAAQFEAARQATVRIRVTTCSGGKMGSGFVLDPTTVLTNRHVVAGAQKVRIETGDGQALTVVDVWQSQYADLGVVHVERTSLEPLRLAASDVPRGTAIDVVGYPLNGPLTSTRGLVAEYVVEPTISSVDPVLRLNVDLNPGNSGGPVVDSGGRVVGVAFASERATGYGLAVAASTVAAALRDTAGLGKLEPGCR